MKAIPSLLFPAIFYVVLSGFQDARGSIETNLDELKDQVIGRAQEPKAALAYFKSWFEADKPYEIAIKHQEDEVAEVFHTAASLFLKKRNDPEARLDMARLYAYYGDYMRYIQGSPERAKEFLASSQRYLQPLKAHEDPKIRREALYLAWEQHFGTPDEQDQFLKDAAKLGHIEAMKARSVLKLTEGDFKEKPYNALMRKMKYYTVHNSSLTIEEKEELEIGISKVIENELLKLTPYEAPSGEDINYKIGKLYYYAGHILFLRKNSDQNPYLPEARNYLQNATSKKEKAGAYLKLIEKYLEQNIAKKF